MLGFPTINIPFADTSISGVYAAEVKTGGRAYPAAVFADQRRKVLEAHLLGFSGILYGTPVTITLCEKIREPMRFETDTETAQEIAHDVQRAGDYFERREARLKRGYTA
jgi:riboflavin kinase/FMN adenylyltransferase